MSSICQIKDAHKHKPNASFIGIVTKITAPSQSQGEHWVLRFTAQDDFTDASPASELSKINCRIFHEQAYLPKPGAIGDVVLVRKIRIQTAFNRKFGKFEAISSPKDGTDVLFFSPKAIPLPALSAPYGPGGLSTIPWIGTPKARNPTHDEQIKIIHMKAAAAPAVGLILQQSPAKAPEQTPMSRKFSLIRDIQLGKYYDLIGEVVKIWSSDFNSVDIYLTDYTENKELFLYADPNHAEEHAVPATKWKGPYGQATMAIRLYDPHRSYVRDKLKEGDFVRVGDVHTRYSNASILEGAMHYDQMYPDKIKIRKLDWRSQLEELQRRKKEYLDNWELQHAKQVLAKRDEGITKAYKNKSKRNKQRLKKLQEQKALQNKFLEEAAIFEGCNPHVCASFPGIQFSTLSEILSNPALTTKDITLPFVNCKYRSRLRVVDFHPPALEDFAHCMSDPSWNTSLNDPDMVEKRRDDSWKWAFVLLVEDAESPSDRLPLFVNDKDAQYLLKMDATDLRRDSNEHTVTKLQEKLFLLWGNLLELKRDLKSKGDAFPLPAKDNRLQNLPFEACIEEYGVQVPQSSMWPLGWQRTHKLLQTTIKG